MKIELIPKSELEYDCEPQVAEAFVRLFRSTWDSLPHGIRRVVRLHWSTRNDSPNIILKPFVWDNNVGNIGGRVKDRGHTLEYNSLIYVLAGDRLFTAAIAHELSHVLFHALDQPQHVWLGSQADKIASEILACELTRRLGFQQGEFSEWINCEVSTKGPYLGKERGETLFAVDEYWNRWSRHERMWATGDPECDDESLADAKAAFYEEHSRFFDIALDNGDHPEWTGICQVKALAKSES